MQEVIHIFDFDGVFFKEPKDVLFETLEAHKKKFYLVYLTVSAAGYFPKHLHESENGARLYKLFEEAYATQTISEEGKSRLEKLAKKGRLQIITYNTQKDTIEHMLEKEGVRDLFEDIVLCKRNGSVTKKEVFEMIRELEGSSVEIHFYTDTVEDLKEVQDAESGIISYFVSEDWNIDQKVYPYIQNDPKRVVKPFYK